MRRIVFGFLASAACMIALRLPAQNADSSSVATLIGKDNHVEVAPANGAWSAASTGQRIQTGGRLKTGEESRATVRMGDGSVLQLDELTTIEIKPPKVVSATATLSIANGAAYFFNRGQSREVSLETPSANGAIRGTAFLVRVNRAGGQTAVAMIEGLFDLFNKGGSVTARQGELATAGAGGPGKNFYGENGDTAPWYLVLEHRLPAVEALGKASKPQLLNAVSAGIGQYRQVASQLAGSAVITRKSWARDVLRVAFKAVGSDCGARAKILRSVIAADPEEASALTEEALGLSPECAKEFAANTPTPMETATFDNAPVPDNFGNPPGLNGSFGGGQGNVVAICHNGRTLFLSPAAAERQLRENPGDRLGACQVTPVQNR